MAGLTSLIVALICTYPKYLQLAFFNYQYLHNEPPIVHTPH
jgi:hypothetical protein